MLQNFLRLASGFDVAPLLRALSQEPSLWSEITERQTTPGSPHGDTETIFLRWCPSKTIDAAFNETLTVEYPAWEKLFEAWPLIDEIEKKVGSKRLGRVILVALKPGGFIEKHADEGHYADTFERFHLCLHSALGNQFFSEVAEGSGEFVHMKPGELWWFDHKRPHWVYNGSDEPRLHLIIDAVAPLYRRERHALSA